MLLKSFYIFKMIHKLDRQVFPCIYTFLLLIHTRQGQSQETDVSQTVKAMLGGDAVLPCQVKPPEDPTQTAVEWERPDLKPSFVFVWHNQTEYIADQNKVYRGRTSLFNDKLKDGDVSLKLSNVRHSDNGIYRCYNPREKTESFVELLVDNCTQNTDNWNSVKWALIYCAIGIAIGVLIFVAFKRICRYFKSRQSTIQDTEARGDQQEPFLQGNLKKPIEDCAEIETEDGETTRDKLQSETNGVNIVKEELEQEAGAGIETEYCKTTEDESQIARDRLNKVKKQLEEKKAHLDKQLQDVDNKREETKKELQSVEEKIIDKEAVDKDTFIKKKEILLQSQWKLNEEKKNHETQRLDIERFLETLEV